MAKKIDLSAAQVQGALSVVSVAPRLEYRAELAPVFDRFIADVSVILEKHGATLDRVINLEIELPAATQPLN